MKTPKISLLVLVFFLTANFLAAQQADTLIAQETDTAQPEDVDTTKAEFNTTFKVGERLKYDARFGPLKGGEAIMSVGMKPHGYSWVYYVKAEAVSAGPAGAFYNLRDVYESYFSVATGMPIKAVRNVRESNYRAYNELLFKRSQNKVISLKSGEHYVPSDILDLLSAFYYARRFKFKDLDKQQVVVLTTYFDDEIYPVKIRYKETETIRTKFGKVRCLKFVPVVEPGRIFETEDDLKIWISDDQNRIPVRMQIDLTVGSIKCNLVDYEGLKNEFTSLVKPKRKYRK